RKLRHHQTKENQFLSGRWDRKFFVGVDPASLACKSTIYTIRSEELPFSYVVMCDI
ncbi:Os12g0510200, partial [Oryza sativa Japonica Group]